MRAHGRKYEMGRRFAILIGLAATGVMALGAQTGPATEVVRKYDTELTIRWCRGCALDPARWNELRRLVGTVWSEDVPGLDRGDLVRKCMNRRRVILFKQRPGADRKLGADRSSGGDPTIVSSRSGDWNVSAPKGTLHRGDHVYAKATRKVGDGFVCRADRSETLTLGRHWPVTE